MIDRVHGGPRAGFVLVAVLGILALLSVVCAILASTVRTERLAGMAWLQKVEVRILADAASEMAVAQLWEHARRSPVSVPPEAVSNDLYVPRGGEEDDAGMRAVLGDEDHVYEVRAVDLSGLVHLNSGLLTRPGDPDRPVTAWERGEAWRQSARQLERLLDNLALVVGCEATGIGARVIEARPADGYRRVADLLSLTAEDGAEVVTEDEYARLAPFLTCDGLDDPKAPSSSGLDGYAPRAPVHVNAAPAEVLAAVFLGLGGRCHRWTLDETGEQEATLAPSLTLEQARGVARAIVARRRLAPIPDRAGLAIVLGEALAGAGVLTPGLALDVLLAQADPNPGCPPAANLDVAVRAPLQKSAISDEQGRPRSTTELCFQGLGRYRLEVRARIEDLLGVWAEAEARRVVQVHQVLRHTSQEDFARAATGAPDAVRLLPEPVQQIAPHPVFGAVVLPTRRAVPAGGTSFLAPLDGDVAPVVTAVGPGTPIFGGAVGGRAWAGQVSQESVFRGGMFRPDGVYISGGEGARNEIYYESHVIPAATGSENVPLIEGTISFWVKLQREAVCFLVSATNIDLQGPTDPVKGVHTSVFLTAEGLGAERVYFSDFYRPSLAGKGAPQSLPAEDDIFANRMGAGFRKRRGKRVVTAAQRKGPPGEAFPLSRVVVQSDARLMPGVWYRVALRWSDGISQDTHLYLDGKRVGAVRDSAPADTAWVSVFDSVLNEFRFGPLYRDPEALPLTGASGAPPEGPSDAMPGGGVPSAHPWATYSDLAVDRGGGSEAAVRFETEGRYRGRFLLGGGGGDAGAARRAWAHAWGPVPANLAWNARTTAEVAAREEDALRWRHLDETWVTAQVSSGTSSPAGVVFSGGLPTAAVAGLDYELRLQSRQGRLTPAVEDVRLTVLLRGGGGRELPDEAP